MHKVIYRQQLVILYLLGDKYQYNNIYRIIDEITACIKAIKNKLKDYGFDESKLLLSIGGHSAGAHYRLVRSRSHSTARSSLHSRHLQDYYSS